MNGGKRRGFRAFLSGLRYAAFFYLISNSENAVWIRCKLKPNFSLPLRNWFSLRQDYDGQSLKGRQSSLLTQLPAVAKAMADTVVWLSPKEKAKAARGSRRSEVAESVVERLRMARPVI